MIPTFKWLLRGHYCIDEQSRRKRLKVQAKEKIEQAKEIMRRHNRAKRKKKAKRRKKDG